MKLESSVEFYFITDLLQIATIEITPLTRLKNLQEIYLTNCTLGALLKEILQNRKL
jgi:hypothetical protein